MLRYPILIQIVHTPLIWTSLRFHLIGSLHFRVVSTYGILIVWQKVRTEKGIWMDTAVYPRVEATSTVCGIRHQVWVSNVWAWAKIQKNWIVLQRIRCAPTVLEPPAYHLSWLRRHNKNIKFCASARTSTYWVWMLYAWVSLLFWATAQARL